MEVLLGLVAVVAVAFGVLLALLHPRKKQRQTHHRRREVVQEAVPPELGKLDIQDPPPHQEDWTPLLKTLDEFDKRGKKSASGEVVH
jgi:hypothetical protein